MSMEENDVISRLKEIEEKEDIVALNALVAELGATVPEQYREAISEVYGGIYSYWYHDLVCGKIAEDQRDSFVQSLLDIIASTEKINPGSNYYQQRAACYEQLSGIKAAPLDKLSAIQKAIDEYTIASDNQKMVNALLDRMFITATFTDDEFNEVYTYFQASLVEYSDDVVPALLYASFRVLEHSLSWHTRFINTFNTALSSFVAARPIIALTWCNELVTILEYQNYNLTTAYENELNKQTFALLKVLTDYQSDNKNLLNQLGNAFEKAGKRLKAGQLPYYEVALKYFVKGHTIDSATWTFPVYATNVLMAMAEIYHQQGDSVKVVELFEMGRILFSNVPDNETNFTLNLYWGDYLTAYARLAYDYKAPAILEEAILKLEIAKRLGNNYYSQPFVSLARIALKTGDMDKCLEIIKACDTIFSNEYYAYDFGGFGRDEDFKEVIELYKLSK